MNNGSNNYIHYTQYHKYRITYFFCKLNTSNKRIHYKEEIQDN